MADGSSQRYPKRVRKPVDKELSNQWQNPKRWLAKDKEALLSALRKYGDRDVDLLAAKVGNKTPSSVYNYLLMHKKIAAEESSPERTERHERLHRWVEHIKSKKQKNPSPNPVALSMLMISLLEDHPVPTDDEVDFKAAYYYMFELLSGRQMDRCELEKLSQPTLRFIKLSTLKMMKMALNRMSHFHNKFVESANTEELFSDQSVKHLPGPVRRLVLHKHLNPLRLNEQSTDHDALMGSNPSLADTTNVEESREATTKDNTGSQNKIELS